MVARSSQPAEQLRWFRQIIKAAKSLGERRVEIPIAFAEALLRMAERARREVRGRAPLTERERMRERLIIDAAIRRKAQLIANRVPRGKAAKQAAEEARKKLGKGRNLDVSTIMRRMQQGRRQ